MSGPGEHDAPDAAPGSDFTAGAQREDGREDDLPDAPLFALLRMIADRIGVDRIERVWLFPPRRLKAGETSVVVVAAFAELDPQRRRVYAAHYTAPADPKTEARLVLDEYGTAPAERVGRVVEEVVERIKENAPPQPPRAVAIGGDDAEWAVMLHDLAGQFLAEAAENPRLGR